MKNSKNTFLVMLGVLVFTVMAVGLPNAILAAGPVRTPLACTALSTPYITVVNPNGGNTYSQGSNLTVNWTTCNIPASTTMYMGFVTSPTATFAISPITSLNTGTKTFIIPSTLPSGTYWFKIYTMNPDDTIGYSDVSDNSFQIGNICNNTSTNWIQVINPNGGNTYTAGSTMTATWTSSNIPANAMIYMGFNTDPNSFSGMVGSTTSLNTGTKTLTIPSTIAPGIYWFKVYTMDSSTDMVQYCDSSDNSLNVIMPAPHKFTK